ncbi:MAG: hypothetical protein KGH57_04235 [Candidatus Micrarchaeota archaeon]|nr:hypothetical protein [Candidatus Micrarchaeota archaeon]
MVSTMLPAAETPKRRIRIPTQIEVELSYLALKSVQRDVLGEDPLKDRDFSAVALRCVQRLNEDPLFKHGRISKEPIQENVHLLRLPGRTYGFALVRRKKPKFHAVFMETRQSSLTVFPEHAGKKTVEITYTSPFL